MTYPSTVFLYLRKVLARPYFCIYKKTVEIEFDTAKDAINLERHGVSLAFGVKVLEDNAHILVPSIRPIDGEDRYKAIGTVDGKLWTAVHVIREGVTRFVSVRRSNNGEEQAYYSD